MWNIVTLDGFFEGAKSWDLPWRKRIWGEELEQFSIEQLWRYPSVSAGKDRMTICCGREAIAQKCFSGRRGGLTNMVMLRGGAESGGAGICDEASEGQD